jgi:hypothetical protein
MSKKLNGKAKAKARAKAFKAKQANRGAFIVGTNFKTEPWMGVVSDYMVSAGSFGKLKDIPFDSGNSIQHGKYVIAFDSDATSYADVDKAYLTEYSSNVYHGHIKDLYAKDNFVIDMDRNLMMKNPFTLLEWVDANGQTATERATWKETA